MKTWGVLVSAALGLGVGGAAAQTLDGAAARALTYGAAGSELAVVRQPFLSEQELAILAAIPEVKDSPEYARLFGEYYGAIAVAPERGVVSNSIRGAFNYHDLDSARRAAISKCSAAAGGAECAVVALIRPRGWQDSRSFELNAGATRALEGSYRESAAPKAMAISRATGKWAVATGTGAAREARAACGEAGGGDDCEVAVAD